MIILLALVVLALIYLALISPNMRQTKFKAPRLFAHRGLHGGAIPENSLAAFEAAAQAGYGIELDVQITRDNVAIVFHDDTVERMCGTVGDIREMSYAELCGLHLGGTEERIPTLAEALALVNGRVPLLVELKRNARRRELVLAAMEQLRRYKGEYIMESFDPLVVRQLRRTHPMIIRGQLVTKGSFPMTQLLLNCVSQPDFIAYDKAMNESLTIWLQRRVFRAQLAVWTVRDGGEYARLRGRAKMVIFEGFRP